VFSVFLCNRGQFNRCFHSMCWWFLRFSAQSQMDGANNQGLCAICKLIYKRDL